MNDTKEWRKGKGGRGTPDGPAHCRCGTTASRPNSGQVPRKDEPKALRSPSLRRAAMWLEKLQAENGENGLGGFLDSCAGRMRSIGDCCGDKAVILHRTGLAGSCMTHALAKKRPQSCPKARLSNKIPSTPHRRDGLLGLKWSVSRQEWRRFCARTWSYRHILLLALGKVDSSTNPDSELRWTTRRSSGLRVGTEDRPR